MRPIFTTFLFLVASIIYSQGGGFHAWFQTAHGGNPPSSFPSIRASLQIPSGDFIAVVEKNNTVTGDQNIVLYQVSSDASVVDSSEVILPSKQFAKGVVRTTDGHYWVIGRTIVYGEDDYQDLIFIELDENLVVSNHYIFDRDRHEDGIQIVQSANGTVTALVSSRFSLVEDFEYELLTISRTDGQIISSVGLPDFNFTHTELSLTAGAEGKALVLSNGYEEKGLATFDTQTGVMEGSVLSFSDTPCLVMPQGPATRNAVYDADRQVYLSTDVCFNVFEINQDGSYQVVSTDFGDAPVVINASTSIFIEMDQDSLELFEGFTRHRIGIAADGDYTLGASSNAGFYTPSKIHSSSSTDQNIVYRVGSRPSRVGIQHYNPLSSVDIEDFSHLAGNFRPFVNRAVALGDDVVIVAEDVADGGNILFYNDEAELLDSIAIRPGVEADLQGFTTDENGDYIGVVLVRGGTSDRIDVIKFDQEGSVETIATISEGSIFSGIRSSSVTSGNGNLYFSYATINDNSQFTRRIKGIQPDGVEIFSADLEASPSFEFIGEQFDVDEQGNVYQAFPNISRDSILLFEFNNEGNLVEETTISVGDIFIDGIWDVTLGVNRLFIGGSGITEEGDHPFFVEIDLSNNQIINTLILEDGIAATSSIQATYSDVLNPDFPDLELVYSRYNPDAAIEDQFETVFRSYFKPFDLEYYSEKVLSRQRNNFLPYAMIRGGGFNSYLVGQQANENDKQQSKFFRIYFDGYTSTEEVTDLSETPNLQVFPNPSSDLISVSWDNQLGNSRYELQLLTSTGSLLSRWVGTLPVGRTSLNVDFDEYPAGVYLLRLETSAGIVTQQVVKQ